LEQTHRPTLADHVARATRVGSWVLITEEWYKASFQTMIKYRFDIVSLTVRL
jgi:hypothetical protein